jgi:hypothetical protein
MFNTVFRRGRIMRPLFVESLLLEIGDLNSSKFLLFIN